MEITRESITFTREFMERLPMSTVTVGPIPGALVEGEFMEEIGAGLCSAGAPSPPIHEMIIDQGIENRILCRTVAFLRVGIFTYFFCPGVVQLLTNDHT